MNKLDSSLLKSNFSFPEDVSVSPYKQLPVKVLQFGEGNFLRGFVDWMINRMNSNDIFNGNVVVVQPIETGMVDMLNEQDGLYTLLLRGIQNGETIEHKELITSVKKGINPYRDFSEYIKCAVNPELRVVVSNTTEAGITYSPDDRYNDEPPATYPGKLALLLHKRFQAFAGDPDKGLIIIPCELIDRNGDKLKSIVLRLAKEWDLGNDFLYWLENANHFLNTLVDRIVTGYPRDEINSITENLGYKDNLLDTAEIFHLWVIEGDKKLSNELPFTKVGSNVIWTDDMTPYRTRKVRILNGAHTMTVLGAYLYGMDTVGECIEDDILNTYMKKGIFEEIIPTLDLPKDELESFANAVFERFANPFIKHYLLSITLNSVSKFETRVLPSILEYKNRKGSIPEILSFSFASLIAFYRGSEIRDNVLIGLRNGSEYKIVDDLNVLEFFKSVWSGFDGSRKSAEAIVNNVFSRTDFWKQDLNMVDGLSEAVSAHLYNITSKGIAEAIKYVL